MSKILCGGSNHSAMSSEVVIKVIFSEKVTKLKEFSPLGYAVSTFSTQDQEGDSFKFCGTLRKPKLY
jgi:hypothetical protein